MVLASFLLVSCGGTAKFDNILKLPVMEITTDSGAFPISKANYFQSTVKLLNQEGDEEYAVNAAAGVRLRGNSTLSFPKKAFRLKFDKKQSLFGLPKNKNWVLLADYLDPTLIKNYTALSLAKEFDNLGWTPSASYVNLYFNGVYQGVYLLCEQIEEKEGRLGLQTENDYVAEQKEYPFLVEIDTHVAVIGGDVFNVPNVVSRKLGIEIGAEIKHPKAEDGRTADAKSYITDYVNLVFDSLHAGDIQTFYDLVDIDSFIDYILLNELLGNYDASLRSIWVYKKNGEKMKFGPVWDFDLAFAFSYVTEKGKCFVVGNGIGWLTDESIYFKWCYFLQNYFKAAGTDGFRKAADRYLELEPKVDEYLSKVINIKKYLEKSANENIDRWSGTFPLNDYYPQKVLFSEQFDNEILYLVNHKNWLHALFSGNEDEFMEVIKNEWKLDGIDEENEDSAAEN